MTGLHCGTGQSVGLPPGADPASFVGSVGSIGYRGAKVGGELREQSLDVLAGAVPCEHPMHRRCVANVVQPWRHYLPFRIMSGSGTCLHFGSMISADHAKPAAIRPT